MTNPNINEIYTNFYYVVDDIIYDIHSNNNINKYLNYCDYTSLNIEEKFNLPITLCLGGGGFIQYNHIFKNEKLINSIELESKDYDISFSFKTLKHDDKILKNISKEIENIYNKNITKFKLNNIDNKNFKFDVHKKIDRLHCRINCNIPNVDNFHIAEFSFWFNGKISDNFSINDFITTKLWLYKYGDLYYYLLPLELLTKTLLYAIVDFFERRNYNKCIKYLERIKFIQKCNKLYIKNNHQNICLSIIFKKYKNQIKRKYKMIHDYPFLIANELKDIKNNGIIKCIYRKLRKYNKNYIKKEIEKYKEECKDKKNYNKEFSEITLEDTDDEK